MLYSSWNKGEYPCPVMTLTSKEWLFCCRKSRQELPSPLTPCLLAGGEEIALHAWTDQWVRDKNHSGAAFEVRRGQKAIPNKHKWPIFCEDLRITTSLHSVTRSLALSRAQRTKKKEKKRERRWRKGGGEERWGKETTKPEDHCSSFLLLLKQPWT